MKKRWLASAGAPLRCVNTPRRRIWLPGGAEEGVRPRRAVAEIPRAPGWSTTRVQYLPEQLDQPLALSQYQEALLDPTLAPTPAQIPQPTATGVWGSNFHRGKRDPSRSRSVPDDAPAFQSRHGDILACGVNGRAAGVQRGPPFRDAGDDTLHARLVWKATGANPNLPGTGPVA